MPYRQTYTDFWIIGLTQEQHARTCDYWYLVQTYGGTSHTAFRDRDQLQTWAANRGIKLPELNQPKGEFFCVKVPGSYSECSYLDKQHFDAIKGKHIYKLSNGEMTDGTISDENGHKVVNYCNPNVRDRAKHDYFKTYQSRG